MTSILTNVSSMSAVSALAATQRSLATTENQITTGLRVSSAKDNAAYWSIATSMKTRIGQIQAVNDGLDATSSLLAVTTDGLNRILKSMQNISKDVVQANQSGIDLATLQDDVAQNQSAIAEAARDAAFSGQNLLNRTWTQTAVVNQSTKYNGTTFVSGSGAETYTLSDGQGTSYSTQDSFTLSDASTRHYTSLGTLPLNPMDSMSIVTGAPGGGALQTTNLDMSDINVFGGFNAPVDYLPGGPAYYNEDVNDTATNSDPTVGPQGLYTSRDFAYEGRNYVNPNSDDRSNATSLGATHTFTAPHVLSTTNPGYYDDPSISPTDYYKSYDGGNTATVHPVFSIMTLDLTNNKTENFIDGTSKPYVLSPDDLDQMSSLVANNIDRVTQAMAEVGSEQNLVDGSKQVNTAIMNALTSGVGSLVDADMNEASTRLQALQTQQSLGVQALGIANQNSQTVMKLFGG